MKNETSEEQFDIQEIEAQIIQKELIGKPIYDLFRRYQLMDQYIKGEVSKEEYDAFVNYYNIRMRAIAAKSFKRQR